LRRIERKTPNGYSGPAAVCGVKFVPFSGFRPGDRGINFMSSHQDEIEVWLVPLPSTLLYLPYQFDTDGFQEWFGGDAFVPGKP
jgi:hypothetical protein